mgnify:CR=1 FL=1
MKAKPNNKHGLYCIANEQPWMAAVNLINFFKLITINPSYCGYYFLLPLKGKELNSKTQRAFDIKHIEAKLEENQNM